MLGLKLLRQTFQTITIASDDNDVIAVRGKNAGQLETDSTGGAGNESRPDPWAFKRSVFGQWWTRGGSIMCRHD
jgi:hypothetical protein